MTTTELDHTTAMLRDIDRDGLEQKLLALGWERGEDLFSYRKYMQRSRYSMSRNHVLYVGPKHVEAHTHTDIDIRTDLDLTDPIWVNTLPVVCRYVSQARA